MVIELTDTKTVTYSSDKEMLTVPFLSTKCLLLTEQHLYPSTYNHALLLVSASTVSQSFCQ